jgi:broad specificity phosphatase PhoE
MKLETTITSDCTCYKVDENGEGVLDEHGEAIPADDCRYDCYEEQVADFNDNILPYWLEAKGITADDSVRILGSGMTWRGVSGYADALPREIVSKLEFGNQFILYITYDNGDLSIVRSSHDELGAGFEVVPRPIGDDDSEWE